MAETTRQFTREDIAKYVRHAFGGADPVGSREVLDGLRDSAAPYAMIELVAGRLPERAHMRDMRALWVHLRDVPLDRETA